MIECPLLSNPCYHILELLKTPQRRNMIALAGLPGSGKSTRAAQITDDVNRLCGAGTIITLGMDGFHYTKAQLLMFPDPVEAIKRRGAHWTFDVTAMSARLKDIRESYGTKNVLWPHFEHGVGDPVPDAVVVSKKVPIILVEGLYLLYEKDGWDNVSKLFDERWFLDVPPQIATERLILRHMKTRNMSRAEAMHKVDVNDRLNADLILPTFQHGDWRVQ